MSIANATASVLGAYATLPSWAEKEIPFPQAYNFFMHPATPIATALIYVAIVTALNPSAAASKVSRVEAGRAGAGAKTKSSSSGRAMTAVVLIHNLILCVYSAWTMVGSFRSLRDSFSSQSFFDAACDVDGRRWAQGGMLYWSYLFYLSKYYELLDTAILIAKGRRASLLQVYHHTGVILVMYLNVVTSTPPGWILVLFNSTIHTLMYGYYSATTLGISIPGKKYLTRLQISQFLVGMALAIAHAFIPGCMQGTGIALVGDVAYLIPLVYLFKQFSRRTYGAKDAAGAKIKAN